MPGLVMMKQILSSGISNDLATTGKLYGARFSFALLYYTLDTLFPNRTAAPQRQPAASQGR
jgi:hypothetical protein